MSRSRPYDTWKNLQGASPPKPQRGRLRVFRTMPAKSTSFFRFWGSDPDVFADVLVCPLSAYRRPLPTLWGAYIPKSRKIYLGNTRDVKTFFHEASHHIITLRMPSLYRTPQGRAVEETVADIAAAVAIKRVPVPKGVGWSLIEMGQLKSCRKPQFDEEGDPYLPGKCILSALKTRPKLILKIFS